MRTLAALLVLLVLIVAGVYVSAGWQAGPTITIASPEKFVSASTPLDIVVEAPAGEISSVTVVFEQNGKTTPIVAAGPGHSPALVPVNAAGGTDAPDRVRVTRTLGRESIPGLASGPGRIIVTAARPVLRRLRQVESQAVREVQVRLERPRVSILSTHHYVNLGGAEMVVYRAEPADVQSGVVVGDVEYPGYPASGITVEGVQVADPAVRVAFFALLHDQPLETPIRLYARDEAGNSSTAEFDHRTFPKPAKRSRIELDDKFLARVVPAILSGTSEVKPEGSLVDQYVVINSELRRKNAERIKSFAAETSPEMLWRGVVFHPFTNSAVESAFADQRTYFYQGREVDRQVHLGFDLASFANTPVVAANRGKVLFAGELGIYGNCVIVDHGMGVQSLYAHLSSISVKVGDLVEKDQSMGRSGITGLAGGDHLHFTMLVNGHMVNPVEWWDAHWIEDRILRKLKTPW